MFAMMLISFCSFWLLSSHLSPQTMRRLVGYKGWVDVVLHCTIIFLFIGTSTDGLMQAEGAGILFSISLRLYRRLLGYERRVDGKWQRYAGMLS
jgi:hypothetical protein